MGCESASAFCGPYSLKRIGSGRNLSFFRDHTPPYHRFDQIRQSIQAALGAFAALRADGSVVTWGDPGGGGDSSSVQSQLCNVCQVQSSGLAFAAIKADGSVVTWGSGLPMVATAVPCVISSIACNKSNPSMHGFCCPSCRRICANLGPGGTRQ